MNAPLFTDTITIYNHYRSGREELWKRTALPGVQIRQTVKSELSESAKATYLTETSITIPWSADTQYIPPEQFNGEGWTLNPRNGQDLIILGLSTKEIGTDYSIDELIKDYHAVTIKAATDNTKRPRLKHWKVVCV